MSKIRKDERQPFTTLPNSFIQNTTLSWKARGLFLYLYSLPDDWEFYQKEISKHATDGLDSTRAGLIELEKAGYISKVRIVDHQGHILHYDYLLHVQPKTGKSNPGVEKEAKTENPKLENPKLENPILENPTVTKETLKQKKHLNKSNNKTKVVDLIFFKNLEGKKPTYKKLPLIPAYYYEREDLDKYAGISEKEKFNMLRVVYELNENGIVDKKLREKALAHSPAIHGAILGMIQDPKDNPAGYLAQTIRNL